MFRTRDPSELLRERSRTLGRAGGGKAKVMHVEVFDLTGRSIRTVHLNSAESGQLTMNLGECLGIYILRVVADGRQVHQQKLVCLSQ